MDPMDIPFMCIISYNFMDPINYCIPFVLIKLGEEEGIL